MALSADWMRPSRKETFTFGGRDVNAGGQGFARFF